MTIIVGALLSFGPQPNRKETKKRNKIKTAELKSLKYLLQAEMVTLLFYTHEGISREKRRGEKYISNYVAESSLTSRRGMFSAGKHTPEESSSKKRFSRPQWHIKYRIV